jgi:serine/threonine protein kinase
MYITAHEALVEVGILHRDISLSNLALMCIGSHNHGEGCPPNTPRRGVLIDFDYAIWLAVTSRTIAKTDKTVRNIIYYIAAYADVRLYALGYTPVHGNRNPLP